MQLTMYVPISYNLAAGTIILQLDQAVEHIQRHLNWAAENVMLQIDQSAESIMPNLNQAAGSVMLHHIPWSDLGCKYWRRPCDQ